MAVISKIEQCINTHLV